MKKVVLAAIIGTLAVAVSGCDKGGRTVHLGNDIDPGVAVDRNLSIVDEPLAPQNDLTANVTDELHTAHGAAEGAGNVQQ